MNEYDVTYRYTVGSANHAISERILAASPSEAAAVLRFRILRYMGEPRTALVRLAGGRDPLSLI